MIRRHGWILLFHECLIEQLKRLEAAVARARTNDPQCLVSNANVKLFNALAKLILETIPSDPGHERYQQGNTLGPSFRHWRRAKIGRRFRLFFRFNAQAKVIIFAWVNDTHNLRSAGSKTDPYAVFRKMLDSGHPPDNWAALPAAGKSEWKPKS
jgi:toxin YhaV